MGTRRARPDRLVGLRRGNRLSRYRAASKRPTARGPVPRNGGPLQDGLRRTRRPMCSVQKVTAWPATCSSGGRRRLAAAGPVNDL